MIQHIGFGCRTHLKPVMSKIGFARFRHRFDFVMEIIRVVLGAIGFDHGTRLDAPVALDREWCECGHHAEAVGQGYLDL